MTKYTTATIIAALLAAALITSSACGDEAERQFDRAKLLQDTGQGIIMATNNDLLAGAQQLDEQAQAFCADSTQANLDAVRQAWAGVKEPLKRAEAFSFGPYRFFDVALAKKVDKWPGVGANIEAIIADEDEITQDFIEGLNYQQRIKGYPAVGYLLYGAPAESTPLEAYTSGANADRRCAYLTGLTKHALGVVEIYHDEWDEGGENYIGEFVDAGKTSDAYGSEQAAITAVVETMIFALDQISIMKLGEPLGTQNGGTPTPESVEAPYSEMSLDHALWTLAGVEMLYLGQATDAATSLSDYVQFRQKEGAVDATVRQRLAEARVALEDIPRPLSTAVTDSPEKVQAGIDAVDALNRSISGDVSTLLGINPTTVEGDND